ncbi:MAG: 4-(cytidine 5'-diphospho)-2-C-methyl-D-erythritol kinase [Acidobacteria bacterium]|nr:4-(cytidine 5'-diphospho)-2-C-methyl-D-erythritol kinase [Acidobacteriota bacterium]
MTITAPAFAKVNLDLRITGVRPDGYHDLRTVFQALALADTLTVQSSRGSFELTCDRADVPTDNRNLVWKAASLLWRTARLGKGGPARARVHLAKGIPSEAGLGGGSADAAVALMTLNHVWKAGLDTVTLARLAAGLGADVPFFLVGGTALGLGRGDDIYPLADLPRVSVTVIRPDIGVSTPDAYRWYDEQARHDTRTAVRFAPAGWPAWASGLRNDLEPPVVQRHPVIGQIRGALVRAGAVTAAMSGSGSAVFGLFEDAAAARAAAAPFRRPGWTALVTRTLTRADYHRRGGYRRFQTA